MLTLRFAAIPAWSEVALRPHYPPPTVLLIEAHADSRDLYDIWLSQQGFAVTGCASGSDAIARVPTIAPDVIVAELMVPDGGAPLIRALRATAAGADAVLIVLTTQNTTAARRTALDEGADVFVVKPCGAPRLGEVIAAASRSRVRRTRPPSNSAAAAAAGLRAAQRDFAIRERLAPSH